MSDADKGVMPENRDDCNHEFVYSGLRWANGDVLRPGSGAVDTFYGHAWFCERCLQARVERAETGDRNSYQDKLPGSSPATTLERNLLVPSYARSAYR